MYVKKYSVIKDRGTTIIIKTQQCRYYQELGSSCHETTFLKRARSLAPATFTNTPQVFRENTFLTKILVALCYEII